MLLTDLLTTLTRGMLQRVQMTMNLLAVADRYPALTSRIVKLGDLIGVGDIADPVDGDGAVAASTYATIRRGVEELLRLLA